MAVSSLERAILLTVSYTNQFDFPLTILELYERLVLRRQADSSPLFKPQNLTISLLKKAVTALVSAKKLEQAAGFIFLPQRRQVVALRQARAEMAVQKKSEVVAFVTQAQKIPWITGIFVTGSLAMKNAKTDDDIDFMIVTRSRRLWLTRLWVIWFAWRKGKRRSWHGEEKNSWCFNLWVAEDTLSVFQQTPSLYVAYELLQATAVFDRGGVEERLMAEVPWTTQFLPLAKKFTTRRQSSEQLHQANFWLMILEKLAFGVQWLYMRRHITREKISLNWAFFHPRDTEAKIMTNLG